MIRPQQSLQLTIVEIEAQRDQAFKKAESERERGEVLEKQERCKAVERTASAASKLVPALLRVVVSSKQRVLTASLSRRGDRLAGVLLLLLTGGGGESYYHSPPRLALSTTAYSRTLA